MKKGFTLIELLAVILILGLIFLIIIPIVTDVINRAREDAFESSVQSLIRTVESDYAQDTSETLPSQKTYVFLNGVQTEGPELKIGGKKPQNGYITIQRNGKIEVAIDDGKTCITKTFDSELIATKTLEDDEVCGILSLPDDVTYIYDLPNIAENTTPCLKDGDEFTHILDKRDDKTYAVTQIGTQCWFAENLAYTPPECLEAVWNDDETPNACKRNGGGGWDQDEIKYQWWAVMNWDGINPSSLSELEGSQGICPSEWHVPTDDEWTFLTDYLRTDSQYWCGGTSANISKSLASKTNWSPFISACTVGNNPSTNNSTGFNGKPAGLRNYLGEVAILGDGGYWWSSTQSGSYILMSFLFHGNPNMGKSSTLFEIGNSVRCLLDQ